MTRSTTDRLLKTLATKGNIDALRKAADVIDHYSRVAKDENAEAVAESNRNIADQLDAARQPKTAAV